LYDIYTRKPVAEIDTQIQENRPYGIRYLPKKQLIVAQVGNKKLKIFQYIVGAKKLKEIETINLSGTPERFEVNENESQILIAPQKEYVEIYDLETNQVSQINLSYNVHLKSIMNVTYITKHGKVLVGDFYSQYVYILA